MSTSLAGAVLSNLMLHWNRTGVESKCTVSLHRRLRGGRDPTKMRPGQCVFFSCLETAALLQHCVDYNTLSQYCLNLVQHLQPRCLEDRCLPQQTKKKKSTATAQSLHHIISHFPVVLSLPGMRHSLAQEIHEHTMPDIKTFEGTWQANKTQKSSPFAFLLSSVHSLLKFTHLKSECTANFEHD